MCRSLDHQRPTPYHPRPLRQDQQWGISSEHPRRRSGARVSRAIPHRKTPERLRIETNSHIAMLGVPGARGIPGPFPLPLSLIFMFFFFFYRKLKK